jgi:hypothetical protein
MNTYFVELDKSSTGNILIISLNMHLAGTSKDGDVKEHQANGGECT